jgi:hypothetical protein
VGDNARVQESEIGWVSELQGVAAVLLEHWIACGRRRGGSWSSGKWRAEAAAHRRGQSRGGGLKVDEEGLVCKFPKVKGLLCKA